LNFKDKIFISHASEDKKEIVETFIECLEKSGIHNYWYDKDQITGGNSIIEKINYGLSRSKIGVIIFSKHYLEKDWTLNEFFAIHALLITHKIHLIPLLNTDVTYDTIIDSYPLLAHIRFEHIELPCAKLGSIIKKNLDEICKIIDNPSNQTIINRNPYNQEFQKLQLDSLNKYSSHDSRKIESLDDNDLNELYKEIINDQNPELKETAITEISNYAETFEIWKYKTTWDILNYLIFSKNNADRTYGLYILTEMLKLSNSRISRSENYVIRNANELYGQELITDIVKNQPRISNDAFEILKIIMEPEDLFNIAVEGLIIAIKEKDISVNEYSNHIQKFVLTLEKGNRLQIKELVIQMKRLIKNSPNEEIIRKRALEIVKNFHKKAL
jgi:hypothetical protein